MTHPQEQNSEWIEHDGKGMPVDSKVLVDVKFRDGAEDCYDRTAGFWHDFETEDHSNWVSDQRSPCSDDIVAYRIHTPTPSSQGDAQ